MSLAAGGRLGPYEIVAKLGEGGMGEVWRARDTRLDRDVAIKVLPPAFVEDAERLARFEREAKVLAQLHHPNIASIFGLEESDGRRALVLELVEGPTLADRLEAGALPLDEALAIARQIAEALEEAHEKGIVHRDLKPQNVKASREGRTKVLDFGLAKAMEPAAAASGAASQLAQSPTLTLGATQMGVVLGTAAYMAPEQAKGFAVDKRADIWAFGVVLYEMLSGERLFGGDSVPDTLAGVLKNPIELDRLPAQVPPAIRRLLRRCLERNPKNRLHDVADARIVLAEVAGGVADASPPTAASAPARAPWRERIAWLLVAMLAAASGAWLAGGRDSSAPPAPVVRSSLELPPGVSIELDGERAGMPALSPDGGRVAFGAREGAGALRLWVVELATGEARALPGTEGAYRPFWSPDGERIGFFTWRHLCVVPARGGPVTRLAPAQDARGGTWSPNGTIVYAPFQAGPLRAVAAAGGEPRVASAVPEPDSEGTDRFPHFLPDGERFLYLSRPNSLSRDRAGAGVEVGRLGRREPERRILELRTNAVWSGGHLLFVRDGALVAQPFDPGGLELTGTPTVLIDDLLHNDRFSYGVFTAAGGEVLGALTGRQSDLSRLVWRDRAGNRLGELGRPANLSGQGGMAISADGRWVVVSQVAETRPDADLRLYDLERGSETQLSRPGLDESDPIFSRDGTALFFGSRQGTRSTVVRRDLRAGSEATVIELEPNQDAAPTWVSPDGRSILSNMRRPTLSDVVLLEVGGGRRPLHETEADELYAQVSPDGRWLVWASDASGRPEVYLDRFPDGGALVQASRAGGTQPRWHPEGRELFFKDLDNVLTAVPVDTSSGTVSFGSPQPLFAIPEFLGWTYAIAPDGKRFLTREPILERAASRITLLTNWTSLLPRP
jgi:Tol biopolymer transport system component/aminoglycoside phosphotransferase (APT) family kinase protein